jgi:hypothetical protein
MATVGMLLSRVLSVGSPGIGFHGISPVAQERVRPAAEAHVGGRDVDRRWVTGLEHPQRIDRASQPARPPTQPGPDAHTVRRRADADSPTLAPPHHRIPPRGCYANTRLARRRHTPRIGAIPLTASDRVGVTASGPERGCRPDGSPVAALVAERERGGRLAILLRFVLNDRELAYRHGARSAETAKAGDAF